MQSEPPFNISGVLNKPLSKLNDIFGAADIHPGVRPLYPIARAGLAVNEAPVTPKWMRIKASNGVRNMNVNDADFRDELSSRNYPNGLVFDIEVSDTNIRSYTAAHKFVEMFVL